MTPTIKLLQKTHFNLYGPDNLVFIENNCYFIVIIEEIIKKYRFMITYLKAYFFHSLKNEKKVLK